MNDFTLPLKRRYDFSRYDSIETAQEYANDLADKGFRLVSLERSPILSDRWAWIVVMEKVTY